MALFIVSYAKHPIKKPSNAIKQCDCGGYLFGGQPPPPSNRHNLCTNDSREFTHLNNYRMWYRCVCNGIRAPRREGMEIWICCSLVNERLSPFPTKYALIWLRIAYTFACVQDDFFFALIFHCHCSALNVEHSMWFWLTKRHTLSSQF